MKKILHFVFASIALTQVSAQDVFYIDGNTTVTAIAGTEININMDLEIVPFSFTPPSTVVLAGTFDVQSLNNLRSILRIDGDITGDDRLSVGNNVFVELDNGTWDITWNSPDENNERISNLILGNNGFVEVVPGNSLTIDTAYVSTNTGNGISLRADATGYSQLLTKGTVTDAGTMLAEQFLSSSESWRQLASPVSTTLADLDDDITMFTSTHPNALQHSVYWYDASPVTPGGANTTLPAGLDANAKHWTVAPDNTQAFGPASNGKAYNIFKGDVLHTVTDGGLLDVEGVFGNGDYSYDCYLTNDFVDGSIETDPDLITGWNLIPNPYPSSISVLTLLQDGTNFNIPYKAVHVWDATNNRYIAITALVSSSVVEWNNDAANALTNVSNIAPFQAFWVKVGNTSSSAATADESITLINNHRTIVDNTNFFKTAPPTIRLRITDNSESIDDQTVLGFAEDFKDVLDENDALKLLSLEKTAPNLYSNAEGKKMSINMMSMPSPSKSIPLYAKSTQEGQLLLQMKVEEIDPNWTIYLEDKKNGKMHNMRNGDYAYTNDANFDGNRFIVHINKFQGNIDANTYNNISVYSSNEGINVAFANPEDANAEITISNIAGQLLYQGTVSTAHLFTFPTTGNVSLYAVRVVSGKKMTQQKIVK